MSTSPTSKTVYNIPAKDRFFEYLSGPGLTRAFSKISANLIIPLFALFVFLMLWEAGAKQVETSLGALPGPEAVWVQTKALYEEHNNERAKEDAFYERLQKRVDKAVAAGKPPERIEKMQSRKYTGPETFLIRSGQVC